MNRVGVCPSVLHNPKAHVRSAAHHKELNQRKPTEFLNPDRRSSSLACENGEQWSPSSLLREFCLRTSEGRPYERDVWRKAFPPSTTVGIRRTHTRPLFAPEPDSGWRSRLIPR